MKRRPLSPFSLSFLDIMFCGFGAVVLLVLIINTHVVQARSEQFVDLRSEVIRLEHEVIVGEENLVEIRNALAATDTEIEQVRGQTDRSRDTLVEVEASLAAVRNETAARKEHVNRLKSDLKALDEESTRLASVQDAQVSPGDKVHEFAGEGQRQYLTGLKLGGERVLILVDASASMLADRVVNVIRLRNMDDQRKQAADKWQRTRATGEWLVSNLPPDADFQLYLFNTDARAALAASEGRWLSASNPADVSGAVKGLRAAIPEGGTSLYHVFDAARQLKPRPDNILLVTDGLPTQGRNKPSGTTVTSDQRLTHFERAAKRLGESIPVNTILLPMEGDAFAAVAFWHLAVATNGSFMAPARDWP